MQGHAEVATKHGQRGHASKESQLLAERSVTSLNNGQGVPARFCFEAIKGIDEAAISKPPEFGEVQRNLDQGFRPWSVDV